MLFPGNVFNLLSKNHCCYVYEDIFQQIDTSSLMNNYSRKGQNAYNPRLIISILIYAYSQGVFSSRQINQKCKEDLGYMYISHLQCPNFKVLSDFRKDNYEFIDKDKVEFNDFNHALRTFSYFHYSRIIYTFKATYNLLLQGYCTESSFLLRHIVETFIRLKYITKEKNIDSIWQSWPGHRGINGKKFRISYEMQFDNVAQGLYKYYRTLCDMAHGAMASHSLRTDLSKGKIDFDTGIIFRPLESSFVINQYTVYLLAHIEFMISVYPEIKNKMSERYALKYHETLTRLWRFMKEVSEDEKTKNGIKRLNN